LSSYFIKTSGDGEPLIVLHGWGMNSAVWESVRPALEAQYCVSWVDLPGHGSNSDVIAHNMDEIVELILPAIPDGAHLMGWSLGGLIVQAIVEKLTEKSSNKINSVTLVASTPRFSQKFSQSTGEGADKWLHAMSLDVLGNFANNLKKDFEGTLKRFIALQFMGVKNTKVMQRELTENILATPPKMFALELGLQILMHSDFRNARHKIPQHWILAERDRLIPKEVINDLKLLRPDDQITLLENTGHAPFMTNPEEFIDCVCPFINKYS